MSRYEVKTPREGYIVEADDKNHARKMILGIEQINFSLHVEEDGEFILLRQDDQRWKNVKLGNSSSTVGDYGCLITNLSMLSSWYRRFITPDVLAKELLFTPQGYLLWKSIDKSDLPFNFVWRYYTRDIEKILQILYSDDNACVVQVPYFGAYHWLTVIGHDAKRGLLCADPLRGDVCFVESRYSNVSGFAEVTRK